MGVFFCSSKFPTAATPAGPDPTTTASYLECIFDIGGAWYRFAEFENDLANPVKVLMARTNDLFASPKGGDVPIKPIFDMGGPAQDSAAVKLDAVELCYQWHEKDKVVDLARLADVVRRAGRL